MKRPFVLIKTAMSVDGKIATKDRECIRFSNELDTKVVDKLRSEFDAILIGENTLVKDNPRLVLRYDENIRKRVKRGLSENPIKVAISKKCDIDLNCNFLTIGSSKKIIFTTYLASENKISRLKSKALVYKAGNKRVDFKLMLNILYRNGVKKLMVEGGGSTNFEFLKNKLVDEIRVAISPKIIGGKNAPTLADGIGFSKKNMPTLKLKKISQLDELIILHYKLVYKK